MFVSRCPHCLNNPIVPFGIYTSFYFSLLSSYYFCIKLIFILRLPCPFIRWTLSCKKWTDRRVWERKLWPCGWRIKRSDINNVLYLNSFTLFWNIYTERNKRRHKRKLTGGYYHTKQLSGTYTIKSQIPPQHYKSIPQSMVKALTSLHEVFTGKRWKCSCSANLAVEEKIKAGQSSHSSDMRSADCQDVGHLNATIKKFFRSADSYFWQTWFPNCRSLFFTKIKKEKTYAIHGLLQVCIPAKTDVQHDWMVPCCMNKKQTQFILHTPTM